MRPTSRRPSSPSSSTSKGHYGNPCRTLGIPARPFRQQRPHPGLFRNKKRFTIRFTRTLKRFSFSGTHGRAHFHATAYILFPQNREIPILRRNELPPRRLPTSQKPWEGERRVLGRGEGTFLKKGFPLPSPTPHLSPSQDFRLFGTGRRGGHA